jgi:hypothetical protein
MHALHPAQRGSTYDAFLAGSHVASSNASTVAVLRMNGWHGARGKQHAQVLLVVSVCT